MPKKSNVQKMIDTVLGDAPTIKGYTLKDLEESAHVGSTCPETGRPYEERIGSYKRWFHGPLSGGGGCEVRCSECGEFLYYTTGIRY